MGVCPGKEIRMIKYNVTGYQRKKLVQKLAALTGERAEYLGMPSTAFKVGDCIVSGNGTIEGSLPDNIIRALSMAGFTADPYEEPEYHGADPPFPSGFTVSIPMDELTDTAVDNFQSMMESKGELIKKAFMLTGLPVDYSKEALCIRWFEDTELDAETQAHVMTFIKAMLEKAGRQKHARAKPLITDNPKYSFRVFLNSLGLSGSEYKPLRRELMKNLEGCSSYRHPVSESRTKKRYRFGFMVKTNTYEEKEYERSNNG